MDVTRQTTLMRIVLLATNPASPITPRLGNQSQTLQLPANIGNPTEFTSNDSMHHQHNSTLIPPWLDEASRAHSPETFAGRHRRLLIKARVMLSVRNDFSRLLAWKLGVSLLIREFLVSCSYSVSFRRNLSSPAVLLSSELVASYNRSPGPPGLGHAGLVRRQSRHHGRAPSLGKFRLGTRPGFDPPRTAEAGALVSPEEGVNPFRAEITRAAAIRR